MKRILLATLVAGCTGNADIGISNQPVTCQSAAAGAAHGTVTNTVTKKSYAFGAVAASLSPAGQVAGVMLNDQSLALSLSFSCGQTDLGMYDVGAGQQACPLLVNSTVSASNQEIYGLGKSGIVILDQNTGCLAGRYDITFATTPDNGATFVNEGEVAGWFSVPRP
jgi:hypothetical protein